MRFHDVDRAVAHDGRHPAHRSAEWVERIGGAPDASKAVVKNFFRQFPASRNALRYSEHIETKGEAMFVEAERMGLEGIVGKRAESPYVMKRSTDWVKVNAAKSDDFVVVARDDAASGFAFQLAPDHQPPRWPDPEHPQQMHLDVMVDDVDAAEPMVLALGARRLAGGDHVYADPAGHPFCLIPRPGWAPPVLG